MTNDPDERPTEPDGTVLTPDELDITEDQRVFKLDDGRFLISGEADEGKRPPNVSDLPNSLKRAHREPDGLNAETVHRWLHNRLEATNSRYGFDITAVFEGAVVHQELFSNDVITTFENLLVWYAQHVGGDTPVEDVLGILIAQSTTPIRLPPDAVESITQTYGLAETDTIGDLYRLVRREGGLRFPARDDETVPG